MQDDSFTKLILKVDEEEIKELVANYIAMNEQNEDKFKYVVKM